MDLPGIAKKLGPEFIRFFVVGVGATIVHLAVYYAINAYFDLSDATPLALNISYATGYLLSFVGNYIASLKWTFKTEGSVAKGAGFAFSHLVNWGMHQGLLNFFTLVVGIPANWAPIPIYLIVVPVNFLLVRFFLKR